jgi:hypothetical protein
MKRTMDALTSLGVLVGVLLAATALTDCGGSKTGGPSGVGGATQGTGGVLGVGGSGGATQGTGGVTATGNGGSTGAAGGGGMGGAATGGAGTGSGGATGIATGGVMTGAGGIPADGGGAGAGGSLGGNVGNGGNVGGIGGNAGGGGGSAGRPAGAGGGAGTAGATGGGRTGGSGGTGGIYPCPEVLPSSGDICSYSGRGYVVRCQYDECPPGTLTGPRYMASCPTSPTMSESWTVTELDCPPAIECGECPPGVNCGAICRWDDNCGKNQCLVEQICLRMVYPDGRWNWDCAPNNCGAQPLDCSCVGAVCGQGVQPGDWQCTAADAPTITCECIDC